jgi:hypothetical protein
VSLALKSVGAHKTEAVINVLSSKSKNIAFIGMHHIGKKQFYNDVYRITDSLGKLGYISYYESVKDEKFDSITIKKFRKINGIYLSKDGYLDTITNKLVGKYKVHKDYINQPKIDVLISLESNPIKVDVPISKLISEFEAKEGEIRLDSCDVATSFNGNYNCQSYRKVNREKYKAFKNDYALKYRNKKLAEYIISSKDSKIIVIYGKKHYRGLLNELKILDSTWREQ